MAIVQNSDSANKLYQNTLHDRCVFSRKQFKYKCNATRCSYLNGAIGACVGEL